MGQIKLTINDTTSNSKFDVVIDTSSTIEKLKEECEKKINCPPANQRLIYAGVVMKDMKTIEDYNIKEGVTVHLVRSQARASTATPAAASQGVAAGSPASPPPAAAASSTADPFGGMMNPQAMEGLMQSPMMQEFLRDPELIRSTMMANPQLRQVLENNPELGHVMNDPAIWRQTVEMMRRPELMREAMRNSDRALSHIESHPEGFNTLRRMYTNIQDPLMNSLSSPPPPPAQTTENPFLDLFTELAASPLPNPWAPPPAATPSAAPRASAFPSSPVWGGAPMGGDAANPWAGLMDLPGLGAGAGAGGMPQLNAQTLEQMSTMMQNPMVRQMVDQIMSNPQMLQSMIASNPEFAPMLEMPQFRAALQNPELLRQLMSPESLQSMMNMQQLMSSLQGGAGGAAAGASGANPFARFGFPGMSTPAAAASSEPPEVRFRDQLRQLQEMGFTDTQRNVQMLIATNGNVQLAVERLLGRDRV
eukprot:CAMPEP_0177687968 /NCGR_PEP_ID=MMETSP0447-20121125/34413_1 /TAXON_ID=0 /ORGANISM="Stygamoeba regulata, Strain BSH-02190019" /LENGTH=476 /DNA_ID=CAMNT_0019198249 /DNA_START=269 /DNA_END=1697 /DNA_ORIENTATION=-